MSDGDVPEPRILSRPEHCLSRKNIDPDALKVMMRLRRGGFKAFLVGGSVRDLLLKKQPKDFDIGTDARPGEIKKLFRNCRIIGRRFRLAHIHFRDNKIIEVSTFRRKPPDLPADGVPEAEEARSGDNTFGSPHEDALRRDLTINGLFYDIETFSIIDYVGGVEDLRNGIVRTIGDPWEKFREDPLRTIRAVRHAVQAGFRIEAETRAAIAACAPLLRESNKARLQDDVQKDLERGAFASVLRLQIETGILAVIFPELDSYLRSAGRTGSLFRPTWVWEALATLDAANAGRGDSRRFRIACLLLPLLEDRLLAAFGVPPSANENQKETHVYLIECSEPLGLPRFLREQVKALWFAWLRLLACLEAGRIAIRFQRSAGFGDARAWHIFYRSVHAEATVTEVEEEIARAVQAGKDLLKRRRRRRGRSRPRRAEPAEGARGA